MTSQQSSHPRRNPPNALTSSTAQDDNNSRSNNSNDNNNRNKNNSNSINNNSNSHNNSSNNNSSNNNINKHVVDDPQKRLQHFRSNCPLLEQQVTAGNDQVRAALCEALADFLLSFVPQALQEDVPERLWRHCFYPRIQKLRAKLAKANHPTTTTTATTTATTVSSGNHNHHNNHTRNKYQDALTYFLSEAVTFYDYLQDKLEEYQVDATKNNNTPDMPKACATALGKIHICLGDLWRYSHHLDKATHHYYQSFLSQPSHGHAMNQMAVVAQLQQKTLVSLFWYLRALNCALPFLTSRKNMQRLLQENQTILKTYSSNATDNNMTEEGDPKVFLLQVVDYYHTHDYSRRSNRDTHKQTDTTNTQHIPWMERLPILLNKAKLSDKVLLQMLVVLVDLHQQDTSTALCLWKWATCLAQRVVQLIPRHSFKVLSPLLVAMEYLQNYIPHEMQDSADTYNQDLFWKSVCQVYNDLRRIASNVDEESTTPLWDYTLLQGYLPLAPICGNPLGVVVPGEDVPGDASTAASSSTSPEQNRAKVARFLRIGRQLANNNNSRFFMDGDELCYRDAPSTKNDIAMQVDEDVVLVEEEEEFGVDENLSQEEMEPVEGTLVYQQDAAGMGTDLLVPGSLVAPPKSEASSHSDCNAARIAPPGLPPPPPGFASTDVFDTMWNNTPRMTMNPFAGETYNMARDEAISSDGTPLLDTSLLDSLFSEEGLERTHNPFVTGFG